MLDIVNVTFSYGYKKILSDISFTLQKGEIVAIVGENGSGKSTLLKLVATLLKPTKGNIKMCGFSVQKNRKLARSKFALLLDTPYFYQQLTVSENIKFYYSLRQLQIDFRQIENMTERWNVSNYLQTQFSKLSRGQKQRVMLATVFSINVPLLILDEPETGLDESGKLTLQKEIKKHSYNERAILFSTHSNELANISSVTNYKLANYELSKV